MVAGVPSSGHHSLKKENQMHVFQCPRCDMRFLNAPELTDHLSIDHPDFHATPTNAEDDLLGACHCHHHGGLEAR
jgi:hypothetical protein